MELSDMLVSGLELMVLGMGMVFVFLLLLIVIMQAMSQLSARFNAQVSQVPASAPRSVSGGKTDQRVVAAIATAVRMYRSARKH